jgi:hypothetical protein
MKYCVGKCVPILGCFGIKMKIDIQKPLKSPARADHLER